MASLKTYSPKFKMIDNYVYLYHTDVLIIIPEFADSVNDSLSINYPSTSVLTRTAPIYSYSDSGPRSMQVAFNLHRDMMLDINKNNSKSGVPIGSGDDTVDVFIREIQAAALPVYESASKLVNPPLVALRLGSDIFIKGVVKGDVGVTYSYPIIPGLKAGANGSLVKDDTKHRYSCVDVTFRVEEIDPYDAELVRKYGSYRGYLSTSLERFLYSSSGVGSTTQESTSSSAYQIL